MNENYQKKVENAHYEFSKYVSKKRWISYWHQLDEIFKHKPTNVLEIGVGSGIIKVLCDLFDVDIKTVDIDRDLKPNYVASVLDLPFDDNSFDLVVCFQVLEHINYEEFSKALSELYRVDRHYVVLSLPDARKVWSYQFYLPKIGSFYFHIPRPKIGEYVHKFDGQHYWEINKKGYSLNRIISDINKIGFILEKSYRVNENVYHQYLL